jgi:hypothetical protein
MSHSNAMRDLIADVIRTAGFDRLDIYTGSKPADPDNAATGTKLVTVNLNATPFKAVTTGSGQTAINTAVSGTTVAAGDPGWFRFYRSGDTAPGSAGGATDRRMDGTAGTDMTISPSTGWVIGGTFTITDGNWSYSASS